MPQPSQRTILNVDDNEGSRYAITRILEHAGFLVQEAATGQEALLMARRGLTDLVILDIHLPDIDGFEVCRQLKAQPETSRIPVLHVTASYLKPADMAFGLESGADNYLTEPVDPEVLIATIRSALRARMAEESARSMARDWQITFDAISDGVAVVDAEGRIQRSNVALAELLGRAEGELLSASCDTLLPGLTEEKQPFHNALSSRRRESLELEYDGQRLNISVDPIFDEVGVVTGAVFIVSDVTEQRRLEEQFRESQKFETIGTLAAGVAHDYNNLLTSILGNASLILSDLPPGSPFTDQLEDVIRASQRAADLTRQLLAYSGKGRHFMQKVSLTSLVGRIRTLIDAATPKKVRLDLRLAEDLPPIDADPNQVQQIILNLINNAAEAIGEDTGAIVLSTGTTSQGYVFLEVSDTGCGMDAETKSRIFDPFFTTKFTGRGLGLAAVAGIARGHKAQIHVTSSPGSGSTFRIAFPADVQEAVPTAVAKLGAATLPPPTVLVVDDEEMVRRIAKATLESRGYHVVMANDGREAIRQAQLHSDIGIILLDLTMPVMGGEEAIDEILKARPDARVIVSTGYDRSEAVARFSSKRVSGYLQKPYTSRQLAEKVQTVLSAAAH